MLKFKDKIVFVSGGSKGIGFETAKRFLLEGAKVFICSRSKNDVDAAIDKLKFFGKKIYGETADLSLEDNVIAIFEYVNSRLGSIDILVNSAGVSKRGEIEDISLREWCYILDNNLTNCFLTCKHVIKDMKKKKYGKIVNVSSIAGRHHSKLAGVHYSCAKSAIITLTRQLAFEVGKYNINVNAICPSQTKTEMLEPFLLKNIESRLKKNIPLGYIALPQQQADVILFLASDQSSYMTGAVVDVNGGQL